MLNRIIRFALQNRLVTLAGGLILMVWGGWTTWRAEVDVFPDLNAPTVVVMTEAGGLNAEEVEKRVSFPIETSVKGGMGVRRVRSSSVTGFSVVTVEFEWGTDIWRARQTVGEKLSGIEEGFPEGVSRPVMGPQTSIMGEVMIMGLTADSTSLLELRELADWVIRPRLLAVGGVAQVAVIGGEIKEYRIVPETGKMKRWGVTLDELLEACRGMNRNVGGGIVYGYGNEYIVMGELSTAKREELLGAAVKLTAKGEAVRLGDVARLETGGKSPRLGAASVEGKKGVLLTVNKQPEVSTLELTEHLEEALAELGKEMPGDVRVNTGIFRQGDFIKRSIGNVRDSLLEGSLFVVLVLILFLMNGRTVVISLLAIPLSLLASVLALDCLGLTLNTMSLGGMAIAVGSLVDDAIVDVENVYRRLRENGGKRKVLEVVYEASKEVRMPILNSTLIIVASFVPLFFLSGMEGRMLAPLGVAFIVSLGASTVVALTVTPALCSLLLGKKNQGEMKGDVRMVKWIKGVYLMVLESVMRNKRKLLGGTGIVLVISVVMLCGMGRSFLPGFNEGSFTVNLSMVPGIGLEESEEIGRRAELMLMDIPEIVTVGRKTGRAELDEHALGVNESEIEAPFVLDKRSREEVMNEVREKLGALPGVNVEIGQPVSHRLDAMLSGTKAGIAIKVFGEELGKMYEIGKEVKEALEGIEGLVDLKVEQLVDRPQISIRPRREMLGVYGLTLPEMEEWIGVMLGGEVVGQVQEGGRWFDLTVKGDMGIALAEGMIDTEKGRVPLKTVAEISSEVSPAGVNRENGERKLVVSGNASGRDMRSVVEDIKKRIGEKVELPEGYRIELGGQFESEEKAGKRLLLASAISLLVIFLLLYGEYKSVRESGMILLNLPLALMGGVFMLFVTGGELSIPAIIGFISLLGIATRNGMLLVSRYRQLEEEGYGVEEAIRRGSSERLTAILMTALSSALALVPLAMRGDLPGNEIQSPMAIVILGGLLTSTLLNGFVVPAVYGWVKKGVAIVLVGMVLLSMPVPAAAQVEVVGELSWPGVYVAKGEMLRLKGLGVELEACERGQEVAVVIGEKEVEVAYMEKRWSVMEGRLSVMEKLLAGYEKGMEAGEVGGIEVGRLTMEVGRLRAEMHVWKGEIEGRRAELAVLRTVSLRGAVVGVDMRVLRAENEAKMAGAGVKLARRERLPGVELGYSPEVGVKGRENWGVGVGIRVPLWGNRQRVREAEMEAKVARERYEWAQMRSEGEMLGLYGKAEALRESVESYRDAVEAGRGMEEKLRKGVEGGVMTLGEYLLGSGEVYEMEMRYLEVEMEYGKTEVALRRYGK